MPRLFFLTHPEVVIDPAAPVPRWPLSQTGRRRAAWFAEHVAGEGVTAVWSSDEAKALDGAGILSERLGVPARVAAELGENDRASTGYVAPPEFWEIVDQFFAHPHQSVRGWERAIDAQERIVRALNHVLAAEPTTGALVVVSHGGVGRLLTARLEGVPVGQESQPTHPGGGCWLTLDRATLAIEAGWQAIPDL